MTFLVMNLFNVQASFLVKLFLEEALDFLQPYHAVPSEAPHPPF
jgi:hypothetical protein